MILNNKFEAPYNKFAPEGAVPIISKALVKSRLSNKFFEITNGELNKEEKEKNEDEEYLENINNRIKTNSRENEQFELEKLRDVVTKLKSEIQVNEKLF